jgi:uridine phosphorylase
LDNPRDNVHHNFGGQCMPGDISPYVFVPGDARRVEKLAARWDRARRVAEHYEFLVYTGEYAGFPVSACSTGIGGMSVSIAVEELARLGAQTFLRVGVTGPLEGEVKRGELILAKGAVRFDGTSHDYAQPEFPALAHFEVLMASILAAERLGQPYRVGVIASMASLGPRRTEGFRRFLTAHIAPLRQALLEAGVIDGEGESATLFVQCALYGFRAGTINVCAVDQTNHRYDPAAEENAITVALETMRILAAWDRIKAVQKRPYMIPDPFAAAAEHLEQ